MRVWMETYTSQHDFGAAGKLCYIFLLVYAYATANKFKLVVTRQPIIAIEWHAYHWQMYPCFKSEPVWVALCNTLQT